MSQRRIGKYEVQGELGRGTMGEVYRAFDPVLQRVVALKTMVMPLNEGDDVLERFRREAHAAARLSHPNIVTVYDFGKEGPLLFMAMELLKGTDLRDALDGGELRTLAERLDVMDGVLAALEYAHAEGVVHRDIKPANIHLGPKPATIHVGLGRHVKIMDFGLARVGTSEMTQEGIVLGTPNYMSPEQALGDRVDGRTDLFSAGAVLYELLTGHKPFEAESTPSVLFQVVHKEAPPVTQWAPDAPEAVVAVVRKALQKDREQRFQSAGEMRAAIAEARRAAAAPARPAAPPLPAPRPAPPATRLTPPPLPPHARNPDGSMPPIVRRSGPPPVVGPPSSSQILPPPSAAPPALPPAAPPTRKGRTLAPVLAIGALAAVAIPAALLFWVARPVAKPPAPAPVATASGSARVDALTEALVATQLQLARRELDDKNYAAAARQAENALGLAPGHAEATRVLQEAQARARELEDAVAAARELAAKGDFEAASQQLAQVLELDPRHPAAVELSARLNSLFRTRAANAAESMRQARAQAAAAGATQQADYQAAADRAGAADALLRRNEFAQATRAYLEARDGFDRAARAVARPTPARRRRPPPRPRPRRRPRRSARGSPPSRRGRRPPTRRRRRRPASSPRRRRPSRPRRAARRRASRPATSRPSGRPSSPGSSSSRSSRRRCARATRSWCGCASSTKAAARSACARSRWSWSSTAAGPASTRSCSRRASRSSARRSWPSTPAGGARSVRGRSRPC
ncbi:MAG: serine/threonine-protein kinase [Vicinamibacteria bacterium]